MKKRKHTVKQQKVLNYYDEYVKGNIKGSEIAKLTEVNTSYVYSIMNKETTMRAWNEQEQKILKLKEENKKY